MNISLAQFSQDNAMTKSIVYCQYGSLALHAEMQANTHTHTRTHAHKHAHKANDQIARTLDASAVVVVINVFCCRLFTHMLQQ